MIHIINIQIKISIILISLLCIK